jgi:hypothetical protein
MILEDFSANVILYGFTSCNPDDLTSNPVIVFIDEMMVRS